MKSLDLESYVVSLESSMRSLLEGLSTEENNQTARYLKSVSIIAQTILQLRNFIVGYEFQKQEEILFFKEIKPRFAAEYYYYTRLAEFKANEPVLSSQKIEYYNSAWKTVLDFFKDFGELNYYLLSGATHLDDKYFLRGNIPTNEIQFDREFSTKYDDLLSQLRGARSFAEYLRNEMIQLSGDQSKISSLTWTGSKTDLIELIYGLETIGAFNAGKADIKDIATLFESAFNITLGNVYRQFLDIKLRKKGKTTFLDEMREKLDVRISDVG